MFEEEIKAFPLADEHGHEFTDPAVKRIIS